MKQSSVGNCTRPHMMYSNSGSESVLLLKENNNPVFFEKESINKIDAKYEILITIMASSAQQESEPLSKNMKMGIQYHFHQEKVLVNTRNFLSYDKDEERHLIINPAEAEIVKRIFREYLEGASCMKIARDRNVTAS